MQAGETPRRDSQGRRAGMPEALTYVPLDLKRFTRQTLPIPTQRLVQRLHRAAMRRHARVLLGTRQRLHGSVQLACFLSEPLDDPESRLLLAEQVAHAATREQLRTPCAAWQWPLWTPRVARCGGRRRPAAAQGALLLPGTALLRHGAPLTARAARQPPPPPPARSRFRFQLPTAAGRR